MGSSEPVDSSDEEEEEAKEDVPEARQYNRTVSDEYNQNTSTIDFNQREAAIAEEVTVNETIDEDPVEIEEENKVYAKDSSDEEEEEKKMYAKDSSDEDDYDYASREVNFDEDESETEEDDTEGSKKEDTSSVNNDEMQATENKTLKESNDDFMEEKKDDLNVVKGDYTQDAIQEVENDLKLEPKKENTTIQDLKEYLMEDKVDSLSVVKDNVKVF